MRKCLENKRTEVSTNTQRWGFSEQILEEVYRSILNVSRVEYPSTVFKGDGDDFVLIESVLQAVVEKTSILITLADPQCS